MPLHFPGYRYCGPGTNVQASDIAGGPVNDLDNLCRTHDLELSEKSKLSQQEADNNFLTNAPSTGFLGNFFSSLLAAKKVITDAEPGLEKYLPGRKEESRQLGIPTNSRSPLPNAAHSFRPAHTSTPNKKRKLNNKKHIKQVPYIRAPGLDSTKGKDSGFGSQQQSQQSQQNKRKNPFSEEFNKRLKTEQANNEQNMSQAETSTTTQEGTSHNHVGMPEPQSSNIHQNSTKQIIMKYCRTLRHYITLPADLDNKLKQGWSDIPYQHICSSMKPSDWQGLNTFARRWTPLKSGFVLNNIIPIEITTVSTGGAVAPKVLYQTQPYLETFIDEDMVLPIQKLYVDKDLPNDNMSTNNTVLSKSTLTHIEWEKAKVQPDLTNDGYKAFSKAYTNIELMDSWSWNTILPSETFQYEWQTAEIKWRHGMKPASGVSGFETPASYLGRWDGGERLTEAKANYNYTFQQLDNYEKPLPSCLIRPMQMYGSNDQISNIAFMILVTYTSEVLVDINDIRFFPIYNAIPKDENDNLIDIYQSTHQTKKDAWKQWPGSNCHLFLTGPSKHGNII